MTVATIKSSFAADYLSVESMQQFSDGSGYKIDLELESGRFSAGYSFFVEEEPFHFFLESLTA